MEYSYGSHPLQKVKLFSYNEANTESIVFLHGGAWRDPNNTYDDYIKMTQYLLSVLKVNYNLVGINYRLSPEVKHPSHISDVVAALVSLKEKYEISKILLVGHSVGATLMLQLLNYKQFVPNVTLELELKNLFFLDGIYDVVDLLDEYPSYSSFVDAAIDNVKEVTQMTNGIDSEFTFSASKYVVVQSTKDELLSQRQTEEFTVFLSKKGIKYEVVVEDFGAHNDVYENIEVAQLIADRL